MADTEYNPVKTAPSEGVGILGSNPAWMGGIPDFTNDQMTPGDLFGTTYSSGSAPSNIDLGTTDLSKLTPGELFGTKLPSQTDSAWKNWLAGLGDLSSLTSIATPAAGTGTGTGATAAPGGGGVSGFLSNLFGGPGSTGLGPYAATAGIGLYEAKQAQKDAEAKANELKGLGTPLTDQSKKLLSNYNAGTLRPEQQRLVDFTSQQGQNLIQSGTALSSIAQQAFQDYQNGKLPPADEQRLQDKVAAQKQELRQRLGTAGMVDSTLLVSQDAAIDNAAMQERQSLLDARFATGNQAYDQWLKSTEAGQQLTVAGQQFASQAFEQMLNDALGFSTAGMEPVAQAIALQIQSDKELSESVSTLLGNLASAYAYTVAGPGNVKAGGGGTTGGVGGTAATGGGLGGLLSSVVGGVKGIGGLLGSLFGGGGLSSGDVDAISRSTDQAINDQLGGTGPKSAGGEAAGWHGITSGTLSNGLGMDDIGGLAGAALTLAKPQGKFAGAASGASSGMSLGGWPGAIIGGVLGYARNGGVKDANPIDASGFSGTTMDQAWKDQNIARLASNPLASIASKLGVKSDSALGKALDPAGIFGGGKSKKRNWKAFDQQFPGTTVNSEGNYVLPAAFGGAVVTQAQLDALTGTWYGAQFHPDGDQQGWAQKLAGVLQEIYPNGIPPQLLGG